MRFVPALAVAALVSACTIQLAVPEGLVDAAKQAAADGAIVSQVGSLEEKPVVFPSPEPTPSPAPLPVPSELQETPTPEPTPTPIPPVDCAVVGAEFVAKSKEIYRKPIPWQRHAELIEELRVSLRAKYPTSPCDIFDPLEQPAQ